MKIIHYYSKLLTSLLRQRTCHEELGALVEAVGENAEAAAIARKLQGMFGRQECTESATPLPSEDLPHLLAASSNEGGAGEEIDRWSSKSSKMSVEVEEVVIEGLDYISNGAVHETDTCRTEEKHFRF